MNPVFRDASILALLVIVAVIVTVRGLTPPSSQPIDTRLASGQHVTFAFVAPTSLGDDAYREQVQQAKAVVRERTLEAGYHYSTVGISDDWSTSRGLELLAKFGTFDELVVGRNWLNSGVKRYVSDHAGRAAVPQVVVVLETVDVTTLPFGYSDPIEIVRIVGRTEMKAWASARFPLHFRD